MEDGSMDVISNGNAGGEGKKSSTVGAVIGLLFLVAGLVFLGYSGLTTLIRKGSPNEQIINTEISLEKGKWVRFRAHYASQECCTYSHNLSYVIPTGKEHYFYVFSNDLSCMAVVRASKDWYDENFADNEAIDPQGVTVEGYVRNTDVKVTRELQTQASQWRTALKQNISFDTDHYIDLLATRYGIFEVILAFLPVLAGIICAILWRLDVLSKPAQSTAGKVFFAILFILIFVYGGLLIHTIVMI